MRAELEKRDLRSARSERCSSSAEKSFYYLTEDEIRKMNEAVTRLAQRLKNVVSVRRRRAQARQVRYQEDAGRNLQYGGVPFKLRFDRRKKEKPQVVVLCDVSDSVRNVSRFMLQFVYSLQDLYSRVRSFIFVTEIGEVTEHFREHDINEALEVALKGDVINVYAHSDFGNAFSIFLSDYIGAINQQDHGDRPGRRAQQLQPAARMVPARNQAARQAADLAQPGEPQHLGLRRQRDGSLRRRTATWSRSAAT